MNISTRMKSIRNAAAMSLLIVGGLLTAPAHAQQFPTKPIRLIVPLGIGGSTDVLARIMAPLLQADLGQPVIVENRPGAEGVIGSKMVSSAPPDGHTLLMGTNGTHISYAYSAKKAYDPIKDFEAVGPLLTISVLLFTNTENAPELKDIVKRAKEQPSKVMFGVATNSQRLNTHMVTSGAGIQVTEIPFKSTSAAMIELAGGRIDAVFADATQTSIDRVRPLAVMSTRRLTALPQVPTIIEAGIDVRPIPALFGIWAPAGTPRAIVERLNAAFSAAMKTPRVTEFLARNGADLLLMGPDDFKKYLLSEIDRVGPIIKASGIEVQ